MTTGDLGDSDTSLNGSTVSFLDRTAVPGVRYYYSVAHVGGENSVGEPSTEVQGMRPAGGGADSSGPELEIISPSPREWGRNPQIVIYYGDGQSGIDINSLVVSLSQPLGSGSQSNGGRAANANIADLFTRKDSGVYIYPLHPETSLPGNLAQTTLSVSISDKAGNKTQRQVSFTPKLNSPSSPSASFTASATSGAAPLLVDFDSSASSDSDGAIMRRRWLFGDGSTALGNKVSKTFSVGGTYLVTLLVYDDQGGVAKTTQSITVTGAGDNLPPASPSNLRLN